MERPILSIWVIFYIGRRRNLKKFQVTVRKPGIIYFNGRIEVRSPFSFILNEFEVNLFLTKLKYFQEEIEVSEISDSEKLFSGSYNETSPINNSQTNNMSENVLNTVLETFEDKEE